KAGGQRPPERIRVRAEPPTDLSQAGWSSSKAVESFVTGSDVTLSGLVASPIAHAVTSGRDARWRSTAITNRSPARISVSALGISVTRPRTTAVTSSADP